MRRAAGRVILPTGNEGSGMMDLGFLGLGQMGAAIAERLQQAGARLVVYDPNPVAVAPFVLRGAVDAPGHHAPADGACRRVIQTFRASFTTRHEIIA